MMLFRKIPMVIAIDSRMMELISTDRLAPNYVFARRRKRRV